MDDLLDDALESFLSQDTSKVMRDCLDIFWRFTYVEGVCEQRVDLIQSLCGWGRYCEEHILQQRVGQGCNGDHCLD
jgi:hypothetical protein